MEKAKTGRISLLSTNDIIEKIISKYKMMNYVHRKLNKNALYINPKLNYKFNLLNK